MTTAEKIQYWIDISDYDLETADAILQTKRYLYVGFMCHQVIEKIFKACYAKLKEDTPPYTHKLIYLATHSGFYDMLGEEQINFVLELEPLNIEARYPEYKERLQKRLTSSYCEYLIKNTKHLQQWTKEHIL
ncbi:DNA-binding protein [Bacteroidia bacterium]|nr:DNA-binding protein [Bacteroidia bacterium]